MGIQRSPPHTERQHSKQIKKSQTAKKAAASQSFGFCGQHYRRTQNRSLDQIKNGSHKTRSLYHQIKTATRFWFFIPRDMQQPRETDQEQSDQSFTRNDGSTQFRTQQVESMKTVRDNKLIHHSEAASNRTAKIASKKQAKVIK